MKRKNLFIIFLLCALYSCSGKGGNGGHGGVNDSNWHHPPLRDSAHVQSVSFETGNIMLGSYLQSINYQQCDTLLNSIIMDADSLRSYLNDSSRGKIQKVKIMFAHTMPYVQTGGNGKNCGYRTGDLTIIVVGYDHNNNYVYDKNNRVLDQGAGCPSACPTSGNAASALLVR